MLDSNQQLESIVVTAKEMSQIEEEIFLAGMPIAALMEKAAILVANRIKQLYPLSKITPIGILVGPGHNGGDALVVARELFLAGYDVCIYCPFSKLKDLTSQHFHYAINLGIPQCQELDYLTNYHLLIDGFFGFGLTRSLSGNIAAVIEKINQWSIPIVSIDLPSGIDTDTGKVLGVAIAANYTFCLGLWKLGFFQDEAIPYLGKVERLDFGIPPQFVNKILPPSPRKLQITSSLVKKYLPLPRHPLTHKYKQGHLLVICGSQRFAGGAILTALGARASGVGMLSIAVPKSLKPLLVSHVPEALIIGCEETSEGAIAKLPEIVSDFSQYQIIACGPGITQEAKNIVETLLTAPCPLVLDADGLNIIAQLGTINKLATREKPTVITPHLGEFRRLFPEIDSSQNRVLAAQEAAKNSGAIVLFKGARTIVANSDGEIWLVGESTPALARGGSGDILTGLISGLMAQTSESNFAATVATAAWCHAQAGILAASKHTELGVDGVTLSNYILPVINSLN